MSQTNPALRRQARYTDPAQLQRGRENHDVLREAHEQDQQRRSLEMPKREKSPMNFFRVETGAADEGFTGLGELNQTLDSALGEVSEAMKRDRLASETSGATDDDVRRSAALRQRKGGA